MLTTCGTDDGEIDVYREGILEPYTLGSLTSSPLAMDRYPSQGSTLTDASVPDSLFSRLSEAESFNTEPPQMSTDASPWGSHPKAALADILSRPVPDPIRKLKHPSLHLPNSSAQLAPKLPRTPFLDPAPGPEATVQPRCKTSHREQSTFHLAKVGPRRCRDD